MLDSIMSVELFAANEQEELPVDLDRWVTFARTVVESRGLRGDVEMNLLFVDEPTIAHLNQEFLGKTGPTDVLSFPIEDETEFSGRSPDQGGSGPGSVPLLKPTTLLGDVVHCPVVAARNAIANDTSDDDETALLIVHGILHLLGMDHVQESEAEAMEALERELLKAHFSAAWGSPRS